MNRCEKESWRARLGAYVDGELAPAAAGEVETHLASCPRCRAEVRAYGCLAGAVSALPVWSAPPLMEAAIMARAAGARRPLQVRLYRHLPMLRAALLAASVAAPAVVLLEIGSPRRLLASLVALGWRGVTSGADRAADVANALAPLGKLALFGSVGRTLGESAGAALLSPPPALVWSAAASLLFVGLIVARLLGLRHEKGVTHAPIIF